MYQGKRKIMNPERHEEYRSQAVSYRGGAIFNAFIDLEDIINKSVFARTYMNHSQSWFSQKLNECPVVVLRSHSRRRRQRRSQSHSETWQSV